jgi:glycosyltransferase involved in cell wall biosynthesis
MQPLFSVIICTYNREKYLPFVLNSIKAQTLSRKLYEVIFINNKSNDRTKEIALSFQQSNPEILFQYFEENNLGLSYARNRGIKESNGKYLTFVDDDAYLDMNFLQIKYDFFEKNPDVIAVGGKILLSYESGAPKWINPFLAPLFGFFDLGEQEKRLSMKEYPRGSNMSFQKSAFEKYGNFNIALGRIGKVLEGSEEKDMFIRLKNGNEKIFYLPNAIAFHFVSLERTKTDFIKMQAAGVGKSEAIRVKHMGVKSILFRTIEELYKWGASFLLMISYVLILMPVKGFMLLKFRYWVTKEYVLNL